MVLLAVLLSRSCWDRLSEGCIPARRSKDLSACSLMVSQILVGKGESIPEGPQGPIVVCTRNDALDDVVASTPPNRRRGKECPLLNR